MVQMKTYSPADWSMAMSEDVDGDWVFLEEHLAVVAESALQIKRRDVEIERLKTFVGQFIDLGLIPKDATHFSLLDGQFFYKKEGDEWMVYLSRAWHVSKLFKDGKLHPSDLISVEMLRD